MCLFVPRSAATSWAADLTENKLLVLDSESELDKPSVMLEKVHEQEQVVSPTPAPLPHHPPSEINELSNKVIRFIFNYFKLSLLYSSFMCIISLVIFLLKL